MSEIEREKVSANVVTYNRKQLLGECLNALLKQTYPLDAVYIIDNASTDGTPEYLMAKGFISKPLSKDKEPLETIKIVLLEQFQDKPLEIHYVRMPENTGSAGGQYEGVKRAYETGYDWIWLMDDDGLPARDALEKLLICAIKLNEIAIYNSVVISKENPMYLSFKLKVYPSNISVNNFKTLRSIVGDSRAVDSFANLCNCSLIPKEIIEKIGYLNRNLFIWGDEVDYLLRVRGQGFRTYTVPDSIVYHPQQQIEWHRFLWKKIPVTLATPWKKYYAIRNLIYIQKTHYRPKLPALVLTSMKILFREILFASNYKGNSRCRIIRLYVRAAIHGITCKLGKTVGTRNL